MIDDRRSCICGHFDVEHADMPMEAPCRECGCVLFSDVAEIDRNDLNDMLDEIREGKGEVHD